MISHAFRDLEALPLAGRVSERDAARASLLSYGAGGIVFLLSMLAFYFLGSLQVVTSEISVSPIPGAACKMLNMAPKSRSIGVDAFRIVSGPSASLTSCLVLLPSPSTPFCPCPQGIYSDATSSTKLAYDSVYFSSYEECLASLDYSCEVINDPALWYNYVIPPVNYAIRCNFTHSGTISYSTYDPAGGTYAAFFTSRGVGTPEECIKQVPTGAQVADAFRAGFPPSYICEPFKKNPPYICAVSNRLSPLQMVAQSIALSTNVMVAIGILLVAVFKARKQPLPKHQQEQQEEQQLRLASSRISPEPQLEAPAHRVAVPQPERKEAETGAPKSDRTRSSLARSNAAAAASLSGVTTTALEKTDREDDGEKKASVPVSCVAGTVACCACIACGGV
jgi:hypothetical protein